MKKEIKIWLFTILRIIVGWHFLFEGIVKLFNPYWTSAFYLRESKWLFSGFFQWLISDSQTLQIVDFFNVWGLVIIGFSLFLGIFTRMASISGALLLLLYYVANPPFVYSSVPSVGHFYIVNYNLIEVVVLIVLATFPKDYLFGIQRYLVSYHSKRKDQMFPPVDNHEVLEGHDASRRELIKNLAVLPLFGAVFFGMAKKRGWISFEEENLAARTDGITAATIMSWQDLSIHELKGKVALGKIKDITISRIIIGGNLVSGSAHARDLIYVSDFLKKYHTDEKVIETLWLCEACGINTVIFNVRDNSIRILEKYWKRGGKIQWLAQAYPNENDMTNVQAAIDHGATGVLVQGVIADRVVKNNQIEYLRIPVEYIQKQGLIAGIASHSLSVPVACVENNINPDFYMKTFHYHESQYLCDAPEEVEAFFKTCNTPWIAFKVLAAGAIKPEAGFRQTFAGGADFACVGMFDFQVIENSNIAYSILNSDLKRARNWYS